MAGLSNAPPSSEYSNFSLLGSSVSANLYGSRKATRRLRILIVGGGLGGLAAAYCLSEAGHDIIILESESMLRELGAGLQVSPNASRLLIRWGLADRLAACAVEPEGVAFRRYRDGGLVGYSRWGKKMREMHGAPNYHIHRADLHKMLVDLVSTSPAILVLLNSTVTTVDATPNPHVSVELSSGDTISGDLIIGADGVKSAVRNVVLGRPDRPIYSGDMVYRTIIPTNCMQDDPELQAFIDTPEITAWMGPGRHMLGYCIKAKKEYNLAMVQHECVDEEPWTSEYDPEKLRLIFADFEPRARKLLALVKSALKWKVNDRDPLKTWIHPEGRVVLLGDACHPTLPYRAQGAAMAFEDAAVIGAILSRLSSLSQLPQLLKAYEEIRFPRTKQTQLSSRANRSVFHFPDGPEQETRDSEMRKAMEAELQCLRSEDDFGALGAGNEGNANQWADKQKNIEQFSYDADEVVDRWWSTRKCVDHGRQAA